MGEQWQHCVDCDIDTADIHEWYMVHGDVWAQTKLEKGCLCVGCLETRIGRLTTADDYRFSMIWFGPLSARLAARNGVTLDKRGYKRPIQYQPVEVKQRYVDFVTANWGRDDGAGEARRLGIEPRPLRQIRRLEPDKT